MTTLLIGADICPIGRNKPALMAGDAQVLFNDLLPEFQAADFSILNLECPLIEGPSPILKTGPTFGEPAACMRGIQAAGITALNLANNHILDHGEAGLRNTLRVCAESGVATVGAGENLEAAKRILVREIKGLKIGVLSMAEHEFSIATERSWGANPLDLIAFVRLVREHRKALDYLVVLLHGGDEFYDYPSPRIRDTCRFLIETGADFVAVQHAHSLGGYEAYRGGHIIYGQGAVLMDEEIYRNLATFHEGYLAKVTIRGPSDAGLELIPFRQSDAQVGARKMGVSEAAALLETLAQKSRAIQDEGFIRDRWQGFCETKRHAYLNKLFGHNRVLRKLDVNGWLTRLLYGARVRLGARNVVCCETHREIIETIFNRR